MVGAVVVGEAVVVGAIVVGAMVVGAGVVVGFVSGMGNVSTTVGKMTLTTLVNVPGTALMFGGIGIST